MSHNWIIEPVDLQNMQLLKESLHISELLASILIRRGIADPEEARYFLFADRNCLLPPDRIPGLTAAVKRLNEAIEKRHRIAIYGDYDVDGVCGIVILLECLQTLGAQVEYYVPDRFEEGYGLNNAAVEKLAGQGIQLLVTVDCGINSVEEVYRANELGMEVIVTDHHTPEALLPAAQVIVNPRLGAPDKSKDLCGAGVVFKLVQSLGCDRISKGQLDEWMELTALATVADIVPLLGENRILVREGLASMKRTKRPGLRALLQESKIMGHDLRAYHVGFILAPRINAAGRLENASLAIDLLLAQEEGKATRIARELCFLNEERRRIEQAVVEEAAASVDSMDEPSRQGILVVDGEKWHSGVIGIAASRLADKYSQPVVLVSWDGDLGRGSARSIPGFNLYDALYACRDNLQQFGGHAMAAGLSLSRTQMSNFRRQLQEQAIKSQPVADTAAYLDGELFSHQLNLEMAGELEKLAPFGEGNPVPLFLIHHDCIQRASLMGSNRSHFRAIVQPGDIPLISFRRAEWINYPFRECRFDLLANLEVNSYQGRTNVQLNAVQLSPAYQKPTAGIDHELVRILKQTVNTLRSGQPAVFIFPTYRVLRYYQQLLGTVFRFEMICPLHGHLSRDQQLEVTAGLSGRQPKIFLLTEPYWHYLYKLEQHSQSIKPDGVVHFWISMPNQKEYKENCYPGLESYPRIELTQDPSNHTLPALWYINNEDTKKKLTGLWPAAVTVSDWSFSLPKIYSGGYRTDSSWPANQKEEPQQVVLADPPYSEYEASIVAGQINSTYSPVLLRANFDGEQLNNLGDNLLQIYPERKTIARMAAWLGAVAKRGLISEELETLSAEFNRTTDSLINGGQVLNSLRIMSDLGLCQYRRKGSIIEIKILSTTSPTLDLADSPYYREGQAEKRAFAKWKQWVKEQLAW